MKGCVNGKLGGGVTVDEFHGKLFPLIADGLNQIIKANHAVANTLVTAFDLDNNGTLTSRSLRKNPY